MPRGGKRIGAGRPYGSNMYGEPTVPMRVPVSLASKLKNAVKNNNKHQYTKEIMKFIEDNEE